MGSRAERLKMLLLRRRERRQQKKSKRMALRLAMFVAAVIALPFAYWQFEMHEVVGKADTTEELAAKCGKLAETLAKVKKDAGSYIGTSREAIDYRISECDEMGVDVTTGSIDENAAE